MAETTEAEAAWLAVVDAVPATKVAIATTWAAVFCADSAVVLVGSDANAAIGS